MFRALGVGSVIAFVCLLLPPQACATPSHVVLWPIHGAVLGGANCPASAVYPDDGCTGAPADGFFKAPNFFSATSAGYVSTGANPGDMLTEANMGLSAVVGSGIARQSALGPNATGCSSASPCAAGGNQSAAYKVLPPFDVAGVTFGVGYSTGTIASQSHPEGAALSGGWRDPLNINHDQAACTYAPTGNAINGPLVNCVGGANIDIEGYDFGAHGCVALNFDGGQTGTIKIKNNRWINGPGCVTPLDGNGSAEGTAIAGSPGGAYITASVGESYAGYVIGATMCTNGTTYQGAPQVYPGTQSSWSLDNIPDNPNVTVNQGVQGACAAGFNAWTLAWPDIQSSSSTDYFEDGANNWNGYITSNGTLMCVQNSTLVGNVVTNDFIDDTNSSGQHTGKSLIPSSGNGGGSTKIVGSGGGSCASGFSPYTVAFAVGSSPSPITLNQRTKRLHVTAINSGGIIGLGSNNNTQAAQTLQTDNNVAPPNIWTGFSIDTCVGGTVDSNGNMVTPGACGGTGDYQTGWKAGSAIYAPSQKWVVGASVSALISTPDGSTAAVDIEQNYIDGFDTRYPIGFTCGNGCALHIHTQTSFTLKYNAILRVNGRVIDTQAQNSYFDGNYLEGLGINASAGHLEFSITGGACCGNGAWTNQYIEWVNNTMLIPADTISFPNHGGTAPLWDKNSADDTTGNQTIQTVVKYNTIVDNTNQWNSLANMGNTAGVYMGGGATFSPNPIIKYNYIDATGGASNVCIFTDRPNGIHNNGNGDPTWLDHNFSLTSGNLITDWNLSTCH